MIRTRVGLLLMDIDTKRLLKNKLGLIIDAFVKIWGQILLCAEFKPRNQERKFENNFVVFY